MSDSYNNMRPKFFTDIIGQDSVKERLKISIKAAKKDNGAIPHILFDGGPGLGKTTLATAIANERGVKVRILNGANLRKPADILPYLISLKENEIIFIDEIHRMTIIVEEFLYPVMEDFRIDYPMKKKLSKKVPPFTMVGATTNSGGISAPLHDRFSYKFHLQYYTVEELTVLIEQSAQNLNAHLGKEQATVLAKASRCTPRIANNLVKWVRDCCVAKSILNPTVENILAMIKLYNIEPNGLDMNDRAYLTLLENAQAPMGLSTIASTLGVKEETIRNNIEPFLLRNNLIRMTPQGRELA